MEEKLHSNEQDHIYEVTINGGTWKPSATTKYKGVYILEQLDEVSLIKTLTRFKISNEGLVTRSTRVYDKEGNRIANLSALGASHARIIAVMGREVESIDEMGEVQYALKFNINPKLLADNM